jgi:hypothetical protein
MRYTTIIAIVFAAVLSGCTNPDTSYQSYNDQQKEAIYNEEYAASMARLESQGRNSQGDREVYFKKNEEAWRKVRESQGAK